MSFSGDRRWHKYCAVIDVGKETVTFSENNMVMFASGNSTPVFSEVRAAKTLVIESNSEAVIPAILTSFPSEPVAGLFEGLAKLSNRYHLLYASTFYRPDADGRVTLRLLNPSVEPVLIHKGTTVGKFEETSASDEILPFQTDPSISVVESSPGTISDNNPHAFNCLPSPNLSSAENQKLETLLIHYADSFAKSSLHLGNISIIQHRIDTGNALPIKQQPYRVSPSQKASIDQHISDMLDQGIIEVSSSPWSSPVLLVKRKDGRTRFCIDYRKLNAQTSKVSHPLPRLDDALDSFAGSQYLQSGYH